MTDASFPALGTTVRVITTGGEPAVARARRWLDAFDACASRFRPGSELRALNAQARETVAASPLLRTTVRAGLWAAERTGGLVDPVMVDALEACGYRDSWDAGRALDLPAALAAAPPRAPAAPRAGSPWPQVAVDDDAGTITRPRGMRLDTGGTGKGLAADALAHLLGDERTIVDLGGDIALRRPAGDAEPFEVETVHPLTGESAYVLRLHGGGVATSGIDARLWAGPGGPSHHLLDPATARPAWTGLISVTALAPTALEAEVLAKAALLSGPAGARGWLAEHGGLLVHDDGDVELAGPLATTPEAVAA